MNQTRCRRIRFKTSAPATCTRQSVHYNDSVTYLATSIVRAAINLTVYNNTRTNTRTQGYHNGAVRTLCRTRQKLTESRRIRVIFKVHWNTKLFFRVCTQRYIHEIEIVGILHNTAVVVARTRTTDTDRMNIGYRNSRFITRGDNGTFYYIKYFFIGGFRSVCAVFICADF